MKKDKILDSSENQSKPVKLGIIGAGFIGQLCHLMNYVEIDDCEIVALAEIRPKLRRMVARRYGIPRTYSSHKDLLESEPEVEAIVAVTKRTMMGPIAFDCLNAGKSLMTEKPMASTLDQAKQLVEASCLNNVVYKVGYHRLYDEGVQKAKSILNELVETEELGPITYVRAHRFSGTGYCNCDGHIVTDEANSGEGHQWPCAPEWIAPEWKEHYHQYLNTYCHNISLLRYLIGKTPVVESVNLARKGGRVAVFNFGDFVGILETGYYADHGWDEITEIYFSKGCLRIKTPPHLLRNVPAQIELYKRGEKSELVSPICGWTWSFRRQAEAFIEDVASGQIGLGGGEDSLEDMRLIEEIWRKQLNVG